MRLKKDIRKEYRQKRKEMSAMQKDKLEDLILIQFQQSNISIPATIMSYAFNVELDELDPSLLMRYCHFINPDASFYFPVMDNTEMFPVLANEETEFKKNDFGIDEPSEGFRIAEKDIELIFVPMIAFDEKGHRVGFGKGYYDRFLVKCPNAVTVGLCYFEPVDEISDAENFDVRMQHVITPYAHHQFN